MRHVTLAFRTLFKTPFVTGIAIVSLALGIGANAAVFSLFDQILLRPLPVPDPDRLVNLSAPGPKPGSQSCGQAGDCDVVFSYPMFRDLERSQTVFTGLAAHLAFGVSLSYRDQPTTGDGMYVSGSYFPTLSLRPALGRLLAMVLRQMSGMMLVGGGIGLVGALGLGRAAQSLLYGLQGHDPVVFALAALLLTLVALGAVYVPARRASLVDPVQALRYE